MNVYTKTNNKQDSITHTIYTNMRSHTAHADMHIHLEYNSGVEGT